MLRCSGCRVARFSLSLSLSPSLPHHNAETKSGHLNETITDILLLSSASALAGHFTSNIPRLALELSTAHKGHIVPYISLDILWCWGGSQNDRDSRNGALELLNVF
jgi:hypothetical protein